MINTTAVSFFTFATFGEARIYRDYTQKFQTINENLAKFGVTLNLVTLDDLNDSLTFNQKRILKLRKGAGYWTWKPNVLEYALKNGTSDIVVYVDCDLVFHSDPTRAIVNAMFDAEMAAYRQNVFLSSNTSKKCMEQFGIEGNFKNYMWTAGMVAVRRNNSAVTQFISLWKLYCGDSNLLIDPLFDFSRKHRHDQSIFSCLINTSSICVADLGDGFSSSGIENRHSNSTDLLVSHGELPRSVNKRFNHLKEFVAFVYFKSLFAKWKFSALKEEKWFSSRERI